MMALKVGESRVLPEGPKHRELCTFKVLDGRNPIVERPGFLLLRGRNQGTKFYFVEFFK